jgi:signal peptidase I
MAGTSEIDHPGIFESIVIAVILALFIRTFVVQAFKIPTGSMENNLLIGDHLLVNKFAFGPSETRLERMLLPMGTVDRGDVIVFKYPEEPERDYIKRVIGLPGETLELKGKKIHVNGTPLDETLRPLPDAGVGPVRSDVDGRARALRPGHRSAGPVLRHGGQPRQLAGQPLLGLFCRASSSRARRS